MTGVHFGHVPIAYRGMPETNPQITFTPEEEALFTPFNAAAADNMRLKGRQTGSIPPAWLCCSVEAREEARKAALDLMRKSLGFDISFEEAERMAKNALSPALIESWKAYELALKQARTDGNPRAFFAE